MKVQNFPKEFEGKTKGHYHNKCSCIKSNSTGKHVIIIGASSPTHLM